MTTRLLFAHSVTCSGMSSSKVSSTSMKMTRSRWTISKASCMSFFAVLTMRLSLRKFCEKEKCGWSLDVSRKPSNEFQLASLSTPLSEIPLRASNKPRNLYVHQGACEHLIHIHNIRMQHVDDPSGLKFGPCRTQNTQVKIRKCSICEKTVSCISL